MRQHVERDLVRINLFCHGLAFHNLFDLALQFLQRFRAGARHRLVT